MKIEEVEYKPEPERVVERGEFHLAIGYDLHGQTPYVGAGYSKDSALSDLWFSVSNHETDIVHSTIRVLKVDPR